MELVVVSGRSGAGKSVALRCIEDLGYYCVDNLPVSMLAELVKVCKDQYEKVAVSIDVRNLPLDGAKLQDVLDEIKKQQVVPIYFFLDCSDEILIKRYSETRRVHPLNRLGNLSLEEAIAYESSLLAPLAVRADMRIDTANLNIYGLNELITSRLLGRKSRELIIVVESFGFKNGLPQEADFVFDARFLPNPHWVPKLRSQTGLDEEVKEFLVSKDSVLDYINQIEVFITSLLPQLERNNRSYLTIAIGCTGGQHRSVYIAQQIAERLVGRNKTVRVRHLTLERAKSK